MERQIRRHSTRLSQVHDEDDDIRAEAAEAHTADLDYPEMGSILHDRPDPGAHISVIGMRTSAGYLDDEPERRDDSWDDDEVSMPWHDSPAMDPPGKEIHRGISLHLPEDVHRVVHDESRPDHERGFALARHLLTNPHPSPARGQGLGYNWTDDPEVAKARAEDGSRAGDGATPVVLHARLPDREHMEDDKDLLRERYRTAPDPDSHGWDFEHDPWSFPDASTREISMKSGSSVPLTGVSWARPGHWYTRDTSAGGYADARHDPGYSHLDFPEGLSAKASAQYGRPDDPRDDEYNGGEKDAGMYWAEPGQQQWTEENSPQEPAPPPPWAGMMDSPVMARLAQIEEASRFFGTPVTGAYHRATTINGTQIDDHGDAPAHGTEPRAAGPDSYDARSTEGDGDPKWSDAPPEQKKRNNGATVGMYPEGMSAGDGPGLEIGAFTASRVPWTGRERTRLHDWADVPTGTVGDFVPSTDFTGRHRTGTPAEEKEREERSAEKEKLRSTGTLDPRAEAYWRDHLLSRHGWSEESAARSDRAGQRPSDMHAALHAAGMAGHVHGDPAEEASARELGDRFGDPYQAQTGRAHPGQGGMQVPDPGAAIRNAVPRDYGRMHREMPIRMMNALDPPHPHDDESSSLDSGPEEGDDGFPSEHNDLESPIPPKAWPMAGASVTEGGPAYTQGRDDGNRGRVFPPPPPQPVPAGLDGEEGEEGDPEGDGTGKGKKISLEIKAHLGAFEAAAASPAFRFEFTAAWTDVIAKAKRLRSEGYVRITHASAGMVIGEVRGDHDTYEAGIQRPPGKPQTIQHWACGCPWASFHQDSSLNSRFAARAVSRYAGRPCSHVMALQFEAQSRGMFGRDVESDAGKAPWSKPDVTVKSWPPYEGDPHKGHWNEYWLAPSASMHRLATPDEKRDWNWPPEARDEWERGTGQRCLYEHPGPCPSLDGMNRTAESLHVPRPDDFHSQVTGNPDFDPDGEMPENESTHVLNGYLGSRLAGRIHFSESDDGKAAYVNMLHTRGDFRGKGVASAMMDDFYGRYKARDGWINHGLRSDDGNDWWASYREPHPEINAHHAHPDDGWKEYFNPQQVANEAGGNYAYSGGRGAHTRLTWNPDSYPYEWNPEKWQGMLHGTPAQRATASLLADGEDLGELLALAMLGGFAAALRPFLADQANSSWGSENVSEHPPVKPYGATEPPNKDQDPGSYGFLSAPDPENWGSIQDGSYLQSPLSNQAALLPERGHGGQEDQESYGYSDRSNTAGPSTQITPRDPNGIRMEEELHGEPEPALPSTTGEDDLEATAAADGTMGGGDAGSGQDSQAPADVAGLGEFGAAYRTENRQPADHPGCTGAQTVWLTKDSEPRCGGCGHRVTDPDTGRAPAQTRDMGPAQWIKEMPSRELARRATPMGDLNRETSPQAQQPSVVTQEPGMGSMDEPLSPQDPSIQTIGGQQWSGGGSDSDEAAVEPGQPQGSVDDIVASFQRSAAARQFSGGGGQADDGDIAAVARQFLSKTADVLPDAEAAELIAEGRGQRARNLGLLRLEGTHYEEEDDDLSRRGVSLDDYDDDVISV